MPPAPWRCPRHQTSLPPPRLDGDGDDCNVDDTNDLGGMRLVVHLRDQAGARAGTHRTRNGAQPLEGAGGRQSLAPCVPPTTPCRPGRWRRRRASSVLIHDDPQATVIQDGGPTAIVTAMARQRKTAKTKRNLINIICSTKSTNPQSSAMGNRSPVSRMTGGDTSHYTITNVFICILSKTLHILNSFLLSI